MSFKPSCCIFALKIVLLTLVIGGGIAISSTAMSRGMSFMIKIAGPGYKIVNATPDGKGAATVIYDAQAGMNYTVGLNWASALRVQPGVHDFSVSAFGTCRYLDNNNKLTLLVPFKQQNEWRSFIGSGAVPNKFAMDFCRNPVPFGTVNYASALSDARNLQPPSQPTAFAVAGAPIKRLDTRSTAALKASLTPESRPHAFNMQRKDCLGNTTYPDGTVKNPCNTWSWVEQVDARFTYLPMSANSIDDTARIQEFLKLSRTNPAINEVGKWKTSMVRITNPPVVQPPTLRSCQADGQQNNARYWIDQGTHETLAQCSPGTISDPNDPYRRTVMMQAQYRCFDGTRYQNSYPTTETREKPGSAQLLGQCLPIVNGICGAANNSYVRSLSSSSAGLCATGTVTTFTDAGDSWAWTCAGANTGTSQNCQASAAVDAVCGIANGLTLPSVPTSNLCATGMATNMQGNGPWTWVCQSTLGGNNAVCSANKSATLTYTWATDAWSLFGTCVSGTQTRTRTVYCLASDSTVAADSLCANAGTKPVASESQSCSVTADAVCGAVNNTAVATAPTSGLCSQGTPSGVTGTGPWTWTCTGASNVPVQCKAKSNICVLRGPYRTSAADGHSCYITVNAMQACGNLTTGQTATSGVIAGNTGQCFTGHGTNITATVNSGACSYEYLQCANDDQPAAVNGACGSANGSTSGDLPAVNTLCAAGDPSAVSNAWPWSWTCRGQNGGTNATCSTSTQNVNSWSSGIWSNWSNCTAGTQTRTRAVTCLATNGKHQADSACTDTKPASSENQSCAAEAIGVCGSTSTSGPLRSIPSTNLCSVGVAGTVYPSGTNYLWNCQGIGTADRVDCSAPQATDYFWIQNKNYNYDPTICGSHPVPFDVYCARVSDWGRVDDSLCAGGGPKPAASGINDRCGNYASGTCGSANGIPQTSKPTDPAAICAGGTPTTVIGSGPWSWSCKGGAWGGSADCGAPAAGKPMRIGTNISNQNYFTDSVLLDMWPVSSGFTDGDDGNYQHTTNFERDKDGWIKHLGKDGDPLSEPRRAWAYIHTLNTNNDHGNVRYILTYKGEGTFGRWIGTQILPESVPNRLVLQSTPEGILDIMLTATDPNNTGNYIRDIHLVREDQMALYEAGQRFQPAFLDKMKTWSTVRFMDFMDTNGRRDKNHNVASGIKIDETIDWADRTAPTNSTYSDMPVEIMVELANTLGIEPWFNMPINATDDYVSHFAQYVKDHLRPDLKVHVEFSNEVWNWGFPQAHYALQQARRLWGPDGYSVTWYGYRAAQVSVIWKDIFGEPHKAMGNPGRVRMVYATQFVYTGIETYAFNQTFYKDADGKPIELGWYFDEYAVAPYFESANSAEWQNGTRNAELKAMIANNYEGAIATLVQSMRDNIDGYRSTFKYQATVAAHYLMKSVTYEAGYGMFDYTYDPVIIDFFTALSKRPEVGVLSRYQALMFKEYGGQDYNFFSLSGPGGRFGNWGHMDSFYDADSVIPSRYFSMLNLQADYLAGR